jgi:hypothetical protein
MPSFCASSPDLDLVAQKTHGLGGGADEEDARIGAFGGEGLVLGGESPAGMDGRYAPGLGHGDDLVYVQICARVLSEMQELLGTGGEGRGLVHIRGRDHGYGLKDFLDGADNSSGRNAPVGDKNSLALNLPGDFFKAAWGQRHISLRAHYVCPSDHSSGRNEPECNMCISPFSRRIMPPSGLIPAYTPQTDDRLSETCTTAPK